VQFLAIPLIGLLLITVGFLFGVPLFWSLGLLTLLVGIVVVVVVVIARATQTSNPTNMLPGQGGYPYSQPAPGLGQRTNGLAIGALVSSLFIAPLGIILGHLALSQIQRTGEGGRGLAIAGLVIGYVWTGLVVVFLLAVYS
jgi:peptidyl-prolyl cis-trans isomerase B (cyclophilin B)